MWSPTASVPRNVQITAGVCIAILVLPFVFHHSRRSKIHVIDTASIRCSTGPYLLDNKESWGEGIGTGLMSFNLGVHLALHYNMTLLTDPNDNCLISSGHGTSFVHQSGLLLDKDCTVDEARSLEVVEVTQAYIENDNCAELLANDADYDTHELFVKFASIIESHAKSKSRLLIVLSRHVRLCYCEDCGFAGVSAYYQKYYAMQHSIDTANGVPRIADRSNQSYIERVLVSYHFRAGDISSGHFEQDNLHPDYRTMSPNIAVSILKTIFDNEKSVLFNFREVVIDVYVEHTDVQYITDTTKFFEHHLNGTHVVLHSDSLGIYEDFDRIRQSDIILGGHSSFVAATCMLNSHSVNILDSSKFVYNKIYPDVSSSFVSNLDHFNRLFCELNKHFERNELIMRNCGNYTGV